MTTPQQQIIDKCKAVFAVAQAKYGVDLSKVAIGFDLKGRAAGMASARGSMFNRQYAIRFNRDMLTRDSFDHVINATVPHEIAHILCFMNPLLGSNHNSGWERVCIALGGTGATRHKEEVVYGKGYTYEYTSTTGHKLRVGDKYHKDVQSGRTLTYKRGLGALTTQCAYSIVGHQGRTLTTPIVKKAHTGTAVGVSSSALVKRTLVQNIIGVPPMHIEMKLPPPLKPADVAGIPRILATGSKASISRSIMLAGHGQGKSYEEIINAMMSACGYDRQLARGTYKANAAKVGVPMPA